jgi:aminoglycoside 6-adenylyltransferase
MSAKHEASDIINQLKQWADDRDSIRAMLLTSTRANPHAVVDAFSDYDVVLVVRDIHPFFTDRSWLNDFGDGLVTYWDPIYLAPGYGLEQFGNVVQYVDGLHIDFTLWPIEMLRRIVDSKTLPADLDVGYVVLLDKDNLTTGMQSPTYTVYIPKRPTEATYQKVIEDFLSDVPYVAKCLLRDELMSAKWCMDFDMKHVFLRQMLEWRVQLDRNWSDPAGNLGKGLKKKLPSSIWAELEKTYVGAGITENWDALFATLHLFQEVGMDVAKALGFVYPIDLDQRVTTFAQNMRNSNQSHE